MANHAACGGAPRRNLKSVDGDERSGAFQGEEP